MKFFKKYRILLELICIYSCLFKKLDILLPSDLDGMVPSSRGTMSIPVLTTLIN